MGVLPIGSPAALLPIKCRAYTGGIAGEPGGDVRTNTKRDQKA